MLVEERIGCRFDEGKTRVIPRTLSDGKTRSVVVGPGDPGFDQEVVIDGKVREPNDAGSEESLDMELASSAVAAIGTIAAARLLAPIVAEIATRIAP